MPAKYGEKKGNKTQITALEKLGYTIIPDNCIKCVECGDILSVDSSNKVYESYSYKHKGNTALKKITKRGQDPTYEIRSFVPYCKTCLYKNLDLEDMESVLDIMYMLDIAYVDELWKDTVSRPSKTNEGTFGNYIKNYAFNHRQLRFKDSDEVEIKKNSSENEDMITVKKISQSKLKEFVSKWGSGYDDWEYWYLDDEWNKLTISYECDSYAQIMLFEEAAKQRLDIQKRRMKDEKVDSQLKTLQDLLGSANVKPVQETGANANEHLSFGVLLAKYEKERPRPEPDEIWKDPDNMKFFGDVFAGQLGRMFDVKSSFIEKFKKILEPFTVSPTKFEDGEE